MWPIPLRIIEFSNPNHVWSFTWIEAMELSIHMITIKPIQYFWIFSPIQYPSTFNPIEFVFTLSSKQFMSMQPTEFSESGLIRRKIQIMIVRYTTYTALFNQNITRVKIFTEVANRKDFGKFRFNVHATTLKIAAFKTRIYCHTIVQPHTILQGLLQRTTSFSASTFE